MGGCRRYRDVTQDAALTLADALRMHPGYVPAQLKLAGSLLAIGKWQESAATSIKRSARRIPRAPRPSMGMGRVSAARGDATAAAAAYLRSVELFPDYGAAHYALALLYRTLGDDERYRQQFRWYEQNRMSVPPLDDPLRGEVARLNMGSVAHIRRGADLARAGKIDEAIQEQQEALRVDSTGCAGAHQPHRALWPVGSVQNRRPSTTGLRSRLDRTSGRPLTTTTACSCSNSVDLRRQKARFEQPCRSIRTMPTRMTISDAFRAARPIERRRARNSRKPSRIGRMIGSAHFHLGRILANQAEYDEAIQHFLKTLAPEDESTPRYLYALAATYARAGNSGEALKYTRTAREQAAARGQAELLASIERDFPALAKR